MPSDESELTEAEVRAVVREELDAALRHQRTTILGSFAFFGGLAVLFVGIALANAGAVFGIGLLVGLFGAAALYGQQPFNRSSESGSPSPADD
ncbi:hypothetical protein SAMN04487949_3031 [Halogranum gelatinilyticum]|uniref:Uncharacterized protein n=1 Tax=Halogranum gelatinilyticum TaxID=660521 RepID=A0A1G9XM87_9EURY|nr:hypothetical protein [Halogranum gelatinilyticum]SDM97315.1 hypothetical protein SAMN04487949_3031 [Halogranum gelatinilyticum]